MNPALYAWAARHGVSPEALTDLARLFGLLRDDLHQHGVTDGMTEAGVQSRVRLAAAQAGYLVFRNNVGAMQDETGRVIRFGLANDSKKMNESIKSCDLIGLKPNGQFWARECKHADWVYRGDDRERAQLAFIELVNSQGGDAAFSVGGI